MPIKNSACKDCADRVPGCHGTCAKYAAYKMQLAADKKRQADSKLAYSRIPYKMRKKPPLSFARRDGFKDY